MGEILKRVSIDIKQYFRNIGFKYGVGMAVAALLVALKFFVFYDLIGLKTFFISIWLFSCALSFLLFSAFRNKWIPAAIYLLFSALLFCDMTYSSYFGKYLSVNMLGAATVLEGLGASIMQIVRPEFFILPADAVIIMLLLAVEPTLRRIRAGAKLRKSKKIEGSADGRTPEVSLAEGGEVVRSSVISLAERSAAGSVLKLSLAEGAAWGTPEVSLAEGGAVGSVFKLSPAEESSVGRVSELSLPEDGAAAVGLTDDVSELSDHIFEKFRYIDGLWYFGRTGIVGAKEIVKITPLAKRSAYRFRNLGVRLSFALTATGNWFVRRKSAVAFLLIIFIALWNPLNIPFLTAVSNQEIVSFHIKDLFSAEGGTVNATDDFMELIETNNYAAEKDGELFGVAKDRNLIVIQVESLQNFVIGRSYNGKEITPNLNKLIAGDSLYFDRFYHQVGSGNTSDAEFAINNSICGTLRTYTYKLFSGNVFRGLPVLLRERGYSATVFHAYEDRNYWNRDEMYQAEGFSRYYGGIKGRGGDFEMEDWLGWGIADSAFYKQIMPRIEGLQKPFYSFVISLSNHHPFAMPEKYKFIELLPEDDETIFGNYIQSAAYSDYSIGLFIEDLKEKGLYDNSIIAVYGDHQGLAAEITVARNGDGTGPKWRRPVLTGEAAMSKAIERLTGKPYDYDTMMNVPLIINIPGVEGIGRTVHTAAGQIDFLPTAAYLLGFEELDTIHLGHNILNTEVGFAAFQSYMLKGSFVEGNIMFEMSRDGVFENSRAWNLDTGEDVPVEGLRESSLRAMKIVEVSDYILNNDLLAKKYGDNALIVNSYTRPEPEEETDPENKDGGKQGDAQKDAQGGSTGTDKGRTGQGADQRESNTADVNDPPKDNTGSDINGEPEEVDSDTASDNGNNGDQDTDSGGGDNAGTDGDSGNGADAGTEGGSGSGANAGTDGGSGNGANAGTDGGSGNGTDGGADSSGVSWIAEPAEGENRENSSWNSWQEDDFWFSGSSDKRSEPDTGSSQGGADAQVDTAPENAER